MGKYRKPLFISFVIGLFLLFDNVSALSFSSTSVRTAYYYENGQLVDTGFVSTNPRNLPQYGSVQTGSVSLRLYQWRYSTGSALPIGRYKILTDITFSSLDGNSIYNFLSPKFEEIRCGSSISNLSEDNVDLINYEFKYINENKFQFNYTIDVLSNSCSLFSGIFKYEPNSYMSRYDVNTSTTQNETLSYYTSYQELQKTDNQDIIDNQDKNTQDVIDNNNSNTQDIIDNQNKNNEELKDAINDGLNSCRPSVNLINISDFTANASTSSNYIYLGDIYLESGAYTLSWDQLNSMTSNIRNTPQIRFNGTAIALQDVENNHLNAGHYSFSFTAHQSGTYSIYYWAHSFSTNTSFSKFQLQKGTVATSYENPGQEICSSKIDDTNDKLDGISGTLNDESPPNTDNFISNLQGLVNDGPISTLILMPFTLLNRYVEGFSGNCTSINLGNLYGTDLTMSCINVPSILGSELWNIIDGLISIFMIYNIAMLFVSVFNDITSLRDTFDSLYTPQHAKTLGKHTSEVS